MSDKGTLDAASQAANLHQERLALVPELFYNTLTMKNPLKRVIKDFGTARALAAALDITPQAVSQWKKVPIFHVLEIEKLTGIPRHELRPDVYPVPE